ncbi:hypothetical protein DVJ77_13940 [Dyella tabacisoli]|uniref:Uncharacterized protein n=2 Tax=Dyella tabacisoli TaxID=2282381 RepID=A0A369UKH3_9GAMM|nr:hypothetical protein DVJ77_13940 [Dyella tabacisoli]
MVVGCCLTLFAIDAFAAPSSSGAALANSPVTLAPLDCMATGLIPTDANGQLPPSLPFYQPSVDGTTIDQVAQSSPNAAPYNHFTVRDNTMNAGLVPITSWALNTYTGFAPSGALASSQRGHVDSFSRSGVQVSGANAGLWLNSMDPAILMYSGSNSLNVGCWYNIPPYAKLFPSLSHELDVSFDTGVAKDGATDGSGNKAHAQAYFQLVAVDTRKCTVPTVVNNMTVYIPCTFTLAVDFYATPGSLDAAGPSVFFDSTHTIQGPIAQTWLSSSFPTTWLHSKPDSIPFQSVLFSGHEHFRITASEFVNVINAVIAQVTKQSSPLSPSPYENLSTNPLDYEIALLNVNGEVYDPCVDQSHIALCSSSNHGQLGMSVSNFRVTSTLDHQASGSPSGFNGASPMVLYRDNSNSINVFSSDLNGTPTTQTILASGTAAGDPAGYVAAGASRVVYRDTSRHLREIFFQNGTWSEWDMSKYLAAPDAITDPKPYVAGDGWPHLVYRDAGGHIDDFYMDTTGWRLQDLSAASQANPPGTEQNPPMGYVAGGASRVVFRDINNQVVEIYFFGGAWHQWLMTGISGAPIADSDPQGYADTDGLPRVVYRDIGSKDVGSHIHELRMNSSGWQHTDITLAAGAPSAAGNPMGFVAGNAPRVIYRGVDGHLHEIVWWSGAWVHNDLSLVRGALSVVDDPRGFVGSDGIPRIEYKGPDNQLHELYYSAGWIHRDY